MNEFLLTLLAQVDPPNDVTPGGLGEGLFEVIQTYGVGALEGLAATFAFIFVVSRFQGLQLKLETTKFDWLVWAMRSVSVLGGAVVAALLAAPESVFQAVIGALVASVPTAWRYISRTIEEIRD